MAVFSSCETRVSSSYYATERTITSYREIPGITEEEIRLVNVLRERGQPLIYASSRSTELFERRDGSLGGYTVLLCQWLSDLFDLPFQPEIMGLGDMLEGLEKGSISFATLSVTPERREYYSMADIAQRSIIMLRAEGSPSLISIHHERLPRFVFTAGSVMTDLAMEALEPGTYEAVIVANEINAYHAVMDGTADAFIATNTMEAAFDHLGGLVAEDFLPLIFIPAAMTAEGPEYEVIISLVNRVLEGGAYDYLTALYQRGYQEYRSYKLFLILSEEELAYIRRYPVIPFATQYMAYPVSFFNNNYYTWEGAVFDILDEISILTGLSFELVNHPTTELPELLSILESGRAFLMPNLIQSPERIDRFLWSSFRYQLDRYALLSKRSFPNIELNDIPFQKVGYARGSAFSDMFRLWFPNALYAIEYPNTDEAFEALERGEINLVMSSQNRLAALTNYYEFSDFKANYLFNAAFDASFAYNMEQDSLRSIIDKAFPLIDTDRIVQQWMTRTYNIEAMRLQAQRPWLIGATLMSLLVLTMVMILFVRNRIMADKLRITLAEAEEAKAAADLANKTKSAFLANMSHELRTPLNSTLNMIREAMMADDQKQGIHALQQAVVSSNDLLSVLNTILEISNIDSGKLVLEKKPFRIREVASEISILLSSLCRARIITWEPRILTEDLLVEGDRIRLMQALTIMLRNAVKFSAEEGGRVSFSIEQLNLNEEQVSLRFGVVDNGIGMTERKLEELYHIFNNDPEYVEYSSSEIMLSACNSIVNAMGSRINVESRSGSGSVFSFTLELPLAAAQVQNEEPDLNVENLAGKRILVVDDIRVNRTVLRNILSQRGLEIIEAQDGQEALELFKNQAQEIDLILMDIMMPVMDGYEAARAIRASALPRGRSIPIIAVTSLSYKEDVDEALNAGMNFHLEKPVDPQVLIVTLARFLLRNNN
ncbi:MAG: response regulator [Treponema sp.]|nr:response regulator [Treponema sp.]